MEERKRLFTIDGVTLAGMILLTNECMKFANMGWPDSKAYFWAFMSVISTIGLDLMFGETKEDKLFRNLGLENKDKLLPIIIKKDVTDK